MPGSILDKSETPGPEVTPMKKTDGGYGQRLGRRFGGCEEMNYRRLQTDHGSDGHAAYRLRL